jgi:hypothetical protein
LSFWFKAIGIGVFVFLFTPAMIYFAWPAGAKIPPRGVSGNCNVFDNNNFTCNTLNLLRHARYLPAISGVICYLWGQSQDIGVVLFLVGVFGFFTLGIWAWAPVWLPELFPTRMRATAVAFTFNAPRFISCTGPLIAGTLIVGLGGYGMAATIVGLFFLLGVLAAPFLPETRGQPLPETLGPTGVTAAVATAAG